jgi:putative ATPase
LNLAQAVTYMACAPKSNASTLAISAARTDIQQGRLLPVPVILRDSHYAGAKRLGHGEGYEYSHNSPDAVAEQDYLGVEREYYHPVDRGYERELAERLGAIRERLRKAKVAGAVLPKDA